MSDRVVVGDEHDSLDSLARKLGYKDAADWGVHADATIALMEDWASRHGWVRVGDEHEEAVTLNTEWGIQYEDGIIDSGYGSAESATRQMVGFDVLVCRTVSPWRPGRPLLPKEKEA